MWVGKTFREMANLLECEFELQSRYYVHIRIITLEKDMWPFFNPTPISVK